MDEKNSLCPPPYSVPFAFVMSSTAAASALKDMLTAKMEKDVNADGFSTVSTETEDGVAYAYTVGLEATLAHPELVVVGAEGTIGRTVLRAVIAYLKERPRNTPPMADGTRLGKDDVGLSCDLRVHLPRATTQALLRQATSPIAASVMRVYYERHPLPGGRQPRLLQILWPSAAGVWPDAAEAKTCQVML
jgi:hypothetical protein